jgi:predicted GH43/DUF377 family glycosyl hydrolase
MVNRQFTKLLLRPGDLRPSRDDMEIIGVFNPGAIQAADGVWLLVRVAERPKAKRTGFTALPRWEPGRGIVIDWAREDDILWPDPRVVRFRKDGLIRLSFLSHLRVVHCRDGRTVNWVDGPAFLPESEFEEFGVEDPRITRIGDTYYFTYVAVSRHGAATALGSTLDFHSFQRHGVIFYPENKDVVLFPTPYDGDYLALHRPNPATLFSPPEMWLARSADLIHWGRHEFFLGSKAGWDLGRIGAGTPPLRTSEGWLEIYHGNRAPEEAGGVGVYSAAGLLLDLENPKRILRRSREPIFSPEADFEREGFVSNVVFPTGIVEEDESYLIYYGASDTYTGVLGMSRTELFAALIEEKPPFRSEFTL